MNRFLRKVYPQLNDRERDHLFFGHTVIGKILFNDNLATKVKIERIEEFMKVSQERQKDFNAIFRNTYETNVLLYFIENYPNEFLAYISNLTVPDILDHPYLSNDDKVYCIEKKKVTTRIVQMIWGGSVVKDKSLFFCKYVLQKISSQPRLLKIPKNGLEKIFSNRRENIRRDFVRLLLTLQHVDPSPAVSWVAKHHDKETLRALLYHRLFSLETAKPILSVIKARNRSIETQLDMVETICLRFNVKKPAIWRRIMIHLIYQSY